MEVITDVLSSPEILQDVIHCVGAERIGVAKEVCSEVAHNCKCSPASGDL